MLPSVVPLASVQSPQLPVPSSLIIDTRDAAGQAQGSVLLVVLVVLLLVVLLLVLVRLLLQVLQVLLGWACSAQGTTGKLSRRQQNTEGCGV